jgi:hypothetical protein
MVEGKPSTGLWLVFVLASSRAGSLPHWNAFPCGSEPAREEAGRPNTTSEPRLDFRGVQTQNANPKVGVLFSSNEA